MVKYTKRQVFDIQWKYWNEFKVYSLQVARPKEFSSCCLDMSFHEVQEMAAAMHRYREDFVDCLVASGVDLREFGV